MVEPIGETHQGEHLVRRHRIGGDLGDQRHVLARGEARDQVVELEDEAHVIAAVAGELSVVGRVRS